MLIVRQTIHWYEHGDQREELRFAFNGKEKDDEVKGVGNSLDFGARIYDSRLGRWLSIDPLFKKYASLTPYSFAADNPILLVDRDGKEIFIHYKDENGKNAAFKYTPGIKAINNSFVQNAVAALDRIHQVDGLPNTVINNLSYSTGVQVNINANATNISEIQTAASETEANITWNGNIGAALVDDNGIETGQRQSPSTVLAHELGHVFHYFTKFEEAKNDKRTELPYFDNQEEKNQIQGIESQVAKYYNEGIRTNHYANNIVVVNSTSTQDAVTNYKITEGTEVVLKENP